MRKLLYTTLLSLASLACAPQAKAQTFYSVGGTCQAYMTTCTLHGTDGTNRWILSWFHDATHDQVSLNVTDLNNVPKFNTGECKPTNLAGLPAPLQGNFFVYASCSGIDQVSGQPFLLTFGTAGSPNSGMLFDTIHVAEHGSSIYDHNPVGGGVVIQ